jgi:glycosyltransferase involved in cell wall biosynthesis
MDSKNIICCTPDFGDSWTWFGPQLTGPAVQWFFVKEKPQFWWQKLIKRPNLSTPYAGWRTALLARKKRAKLMVVHDARLAFWCAVFRRLLAVRAECFVYSFNLPVLPSRWKGCLMSLAFRGIDHFLVHSTLEKELYQRYFSIPQEKILVRLWAMDPPDVEPAEPIEPGEYVSAIGGNGRDYATLFDASRLLPDIPIISVARPENLQGIEIPSNVRVHTNMPLSLTMNILKYSCFTVIPLAGLEVPAGHVTIAAAMYLGKPVIATDSAGVRDYIISGHNGLFCQLKDPGSLAGTIRELWEDKERTAVLGQNARRFAHDYLNSAGERSSFASFLESRGLGQQEVCNGQKADGTAHFN